MPSLKIFYCPAVSGPDVAAAKPVPVPCHMAFVGRAICDAVLRSIQHARLGVTEGAGHMTPLSHPADLTRVLVRQLASDRATGG